MNESSCGTRQSRRETTLDGLVGLFIEDYREDNARELRYFGRARTLNEAIARAALSEYPPGKRHPHQRRIPGTQLVEAKNQLDAIAESLLDCRSFSELHSVVEHQIGSIYKIGDLAVYDIAHRIGAFLGLEPERVYLHTGTREGARALGIKGKRSVDLASFPKAFAVLRPAEVEDCLCIFKNELRRMSAGA